MSQLFDLFLSLLPLTGAVCGVLIILLGMDWMLLKRRPEIGKERKLPRQLAMLGLTVAGVVVIALTLPVSESSRNQVIALIGVLISGVIAFSSTTIVANLMAGIMLRVTKAFRTGDFIRVGDHFGRVVERGLLDTEIQAENRELVSLSNNYLISKPIEVVRSSGTMISGTLSLGYDVHHSRVESQLIDAALKSGLDDPFVQVLDLGNYSITYRVSGLLADVKSMITARSNLYRAILDALHEDGIEIVSPSFMNQRRLSMEERIIPQAMREESPAKGIAKLEEIVFDKAEQSERREEAVLQLQKEVEELGGKAKEAEGEEKQRITAEIDRKRKQLEELEKTQEE